MLYVAATIDVAINTTLLIETNRSIGGTAD